MISAEPVIGYMHRGYEKLSEVRTYPQVTTLVNRIDWLGHFANEVPFILAAEQLMEVEAPPRAQWIRTIFFEMARIANVTLFLGDMGVQLGALTPVFYAFRDREHVLNLMEAATGGRFHPNFDRIGGIKDDLPKGWVAEANDAMKQIRPFCDEMEDLLLGNEIFETPHAGHRRDPGRRGPRLRPVRAPTCGQRRRLGPPPRRRHPAGVEATLDWKVWTHPDGDSFARYWVRLQEVREATSSSTRCSTACPSGRSWPRSPASSRCRPARRGSPPRTRSARWATTWSARATSAPSAARSARPASTTSASCPGCMRGVYVPDVITILASLYFILGDIDR